MLSERKTSLRRQFIRSVPEWEMSEQETRSEEVIAWQTPDITEQATDLMSSREIAESRWTSSPGFMSMPFDPTTSPLSATPDGPITLPFSFKIKGKKKSRKKRVPVWFAVCSLIVVLTVVLFSQGNGEGGAWLADVLRAVVGPAATAQVESWYLGISNTATRLQYQLGNKIVNAPWKTAQATPLPTHPAWSTLSPMTLTPMTPLMSPAIPGEGSWTVIDQAPGKYSYLPLDAKSFIRPDPATPYAIATILQFDPRFTLLHIVGGTTEPGGSRGVHGPGVIPTTDQQGNALLAAFNGGFKYKDGQYGLMTDGVLYVPPVPKAATIAITKEGKLILGAWGVNPLLNSQNTDIVAWRQNAAMLIDQGKINPATQNEAAWGGLISNSANTWRSAIGITANGTFLYAAGNALTAETLGQAMKAAGAVTAMQTDVHPFWVRAFLYERDQTGKLTVNKLNPQMQGTGQEYLHGMQRDFFYLTRFAPDMVPSNQQNQKSKVT